jgi:nitronate monooxygenase
VRGRVGLLPLLAEVLDAIDVPVVAAGGIGSGRAAAAALAAGADAVRVGTRFVATHEADTHPDYADALVRARAEDTVLTKALSVMWPDAPHRVLQSCVDQAEALDNDAVGEVEIGGTTMPIPRLSVLAPTRETTGSVGAMALYAGESVTDVTGLVPARAIVLEIATGAEELLRRWA